MSNLFNSTEVRLLSSREQARLIRDEALSILEKVNEFSSTSRRVGKRAAYKVISRSLSKTNGLPFSIRKYQALSELSEYISLAKYNKVNKFKAFNTDLLPVSHPRSTKLTTMTASAMLEAQMKWVIDDPQITDDSVKSLIASAMMSHPDSPEHIYSMKRIELLPQGVVPLEALVAAYGDGNSRAARSARARLQRRDRNGRFARMFGTFKLIFGLRDGGKASATGRILGQNIFSPDLLDMELPDGRIAAVPVSQGEQPDAFLDDISPEAREKGYVRASDIDIDGNAPVVGEDSIAYMDAPSGFREDKEHRGPGKKYTDEAFDVTVFDGPSPQTRDLIDAAIKRSRDLDLEDPRQIKLGEDGKLWDPDRKLFAVNRRGEKTQFAFAQNWKDALEETRRREKFDEQEKFEQGEEEETTPLTEQLKDSPKKKSEKKEKARLSEKGFNYNIPKNSLELDPNYDYIPEGTQDDPSMLSAMQSEDDLQSGLVDALDPVSSTKPATGLGRLEDENGEEFEVPAEAILSAIGEQGGDKEMALAKAYDTINNNSDNEKSLEANRKKTKKDKATEPKELDEIFDEVVSEEPEKPIAELPEDLKPTDEDAIDENEERMEALDKVPALSGLSKEEKQSIIDNDDYSPFIPKNEDINFPEGMYKPQKSSEADKQEAVSLATNKTFSDDDLIKGLDDSIKNNGSSDVKTLDENGEFVPSSVSSEAWRDALALRGKDANRILKDIADSSLDLEKERKDSKKEERKKLKDAQDKSNKERDSLEKALGVEDSEYARELTQPFELGGNVDEANTGSRKNRDEILETAKTYLEGKDLKTKEGVKAAISELLEAFKDSKDPDDNNYNEVIETINEQLDRSLDRLNQEEEEDTDEGTPTTAEAPSAEDLLDEEEALADKFEQEGMTRSDAQGAASAETKRKYGKTSDEALAELPREEALKILNERDKKETPAEKPKKKSRKKKAELPVGTGDGDGPSDSTPTDEEPPKKIVKYKRAGKRTLLRDGKGVPFRSNKELVDFLIENDFEFSKTVERDGKTLQVNAYTALQDDEEFKALARELRDRFDLDLQPQPATPNAPAQEPIDFDAPAPEKPEETPTPEVIEPTPTPEEVTPTPTTEPEEVTPEVVEPTSTPEVEPTPVPEVEAPNQAVEEVLGDSLTSDEEVTLDGLLDKIKNKLKEKGEERFGKPEEKGPFGSRKDMISKLMWFKWGAGAYKNESTYIQMAMKDYKKNLEDLSDQDLIDILNLYYDEMDAVVAQENEQTERNRQLAEARAKKRKEREDKLLEESQEKPEETPDSEETPAVVEEKPLPLSAKAKEILKALVDRRRKIQRKIDKADLSETATPAQKKALKDELDEITKIIDEIVLGEKSADPAETPATPDPEIISKPVKTQKMSALTSQLRPGDVTAEDYFTITNIEPGFTKDKDRVEVPASRITGYYPRSVEQSTKLWADDAKIPIYRGVTPPAKGDLPELSKPEMKSFGDGRLEPVGETPDGRKIWELRDKAAQAEYESKLAEYKEELASRMATWQVPEVEEEETPTFTPKNTLHVVRALGKDLKPNDIAFRRDGDELSEFFVIEEVLQGTVMVERADGKPAEEKVQIRGYYPGHESQIKSWKVGTEVEVLRGENPENIPAKGDKPAIDSIEPGTLKGKAYKDKNAEISAARKEAGKAYTPNIKSVEIPKVLINRPSDWDKGNRPAFIGSAAELANLKDGAAIWEALKGKRIVYIDFETIGKGFDSNNPDQPIQVAAAVFENGEKVDEINLFINPGVPLDDYYYSQGKGKNKKPYLDKDGNRALNPERVIDNNGTKVDDAFLATQPSIEEQLRKFAELLGKDAILVAHNAEFDTNLFEKWAQKLGIDYKFSGVIDTLELARTFGFRGNDLETVAKRYGIEKDPSFWHNAAADSEVLPEILEKLLKDAQPDNPQFSPEDRMLEFNAKRAKWLQDMADFKQQETELAMATAVKDTLAGKPVSVESLVEKPEASFGPDGSTESADEHQFESIFGGIITNSWIEDDENTFIVDEGRAAVRDIKIGDFVPAKEGGYHEVIDLLPDPEDPNGTIVVRRIIASGEPYSTRVTDKKSPGIGWANGKVLEGTLRRRNELSGKTPAEIRKLIEKPKVVDPVPTVKPKTFVPKGAKTATADEVQGVASDAIETITSGAKSDSSVEEAIKGLTLDDTTKSLVLENRTDGSVYHLSASGVPLKVGDKVRGTKTGRLGEVRSLITSYGSRGYKNYVKVKFDDATKRENISAGSLEIINFDDGSIQPSNLQAMTNISTDSTPVTPEEFDNEVKETAKKADPATQKIADAIIAALEAGTAPWRKPWTGGGFLPTSVATGKMYEGSNVISLWAAQEANGWTDNRWLTYAHTVKLGGFIKKDSKATSIIHWTPKFKKVEQPDGTIKEVFVYTPPKIINLFNVEQAEGIDLPPLVRSEPIPVSQAEQTLLDTFKNRPEIFYKSQDSAYYSPITDTIHLPLREQFGAEQDLFETLVHELAHSTGHTSRVNRKDLTDNYGTHKASRGEEELIAEISVALVAARLGVEIDFGNVAAYAKSWLGALKDDPTMIIKAAKQAQRAVDHMLGKQEEPAKIDEEGNPIEPVGEGVGSEGRTGEEIANDAELKQEPDPEPNVGNQGKTGEEISSTAKTPKNIDPNKTAEKVKYGSKMHTVWNDVTYDSERKNNPRIEGGSGVMFKRIMDKQEVISDEAEVGKYVTDILNKYGYGDRTFNLSMATSDEFFAQNPEHSDVEAAVSRGVTEELPDSHPFKNKDIPVLLVRSRGTTKIALLHEIAHMMEANWKNPNGDDGHNAVWFATWLTLLRSEGFTQQANLLEMAVGKLDEGDTGVINP